MATRKRQLPRFRDLKDKIGFAKAYQKWCMHHQESKAIRVGSWPRDEFHAIHRAALEWRREQGIPTYGSLPTNSTWLVCPTGARILPDSWDPILGPCAPTDPDDCPLLRLSWKLKHFEAHQAAVAKTITDLKSTLKRLADSGHRDSSRLEQLESLVAKHRELSAKVEELTDKREPLLPNSLRTPSEEQLVITEQIARQHEQYMHRLEGVEI